MWVPTHFDLPVKYYKNVKVIDKPNNTVKHTPQLVSFAADRQFLMAYLFFFEFTVWPYVRQVYFVWIFGFNCMVVYGLSNKVTNFSNNVVRSMLFIWICSFFTFAECLVLLPFDLPSLKFRVALDLNLTGNAWCTYNQKKKKLKKHLRKATPTWNK